MKTVAYATPIVGATATNATVTFDNQGLITAASSNLKSKCVVQQGTAVSAADTAAFTWNIVISDTDSMFNGTDTITLPRNGTYLITYQMYYNTTSSSLSAVYVNGSEGAGGRGAGVDVVGTYRNLHGDTVLVGTAGQTITIRNVSGASRTLVATNLWNQFSVVQLL